MEFGEDRGLEEERYPDSRRLVRPGVILEIRFIGRVVDWRWAA